jgi:hypothetical protein
VISSLCSRFHVAPTNDSIRRCPKPTERQRQCFSRYPSITPSPSHPLAQDSCSFPHSFAVMASHCGFGHSPSIPRQQTRYHLKTRSLPLQVPQLLCTRTLITVFESKWTSLFNIHRDSRFRRWLRDLGWGTGHPRGGLWREIERGV